MKSDLPKHNKHNHAHTSNLPACTMLNRLVRGTCLSFIVELRFARTSYASECNLHPALGPLGRSFPRLSAYV